VVEANLMTFAADAARYAQGFHRRLQDEDSGEEFDQHARQ
jgi:hypothetical protein